MGSLGAGIGYGLQKMQVVFLFQTKRAFDNFLNSGWRAETAADVAVAKKGATFDIEFKNGIARVVGRDDARRWLELYAKALREGRLKERDYLSLETLAELGIRPPPPGAYRI